MERQNRNSIWPVVLTGIITTIIVGVGMYWWQGRKTAVRTPTEKVADTSSAQVSGGQEEVETKTTTATIAEGYGFGSPQFKTYESVIRLKTGEKVNSFSLPESPSNEDVIFVSTSAGTAGAFVDDTIKSTNKIYSYNIKTGELSKMYEEQENRLLRTMGIEGTKLIVMYDGIDNSPGPCFSVWADWGYFGYLDVTNPNVFTLRPYTVPDYRVQEGKEEQKKCEKGMEF